MRPHRKSPVTFPPSRRPLSARMVLRPRGHMTSGIRGFEYGASTSKGDGISANASFPQPRLGICSARFGWASWLGPLFPYQMRLTRVIESDPRALTLEYALCDHVCPSDRPGDAVALGRDKLRRSRKNVSLEPAERAGPLDSVRKHVRPTLLQAAWVHDLMAVDRPDAGDRAGVTHCPLRGCPRNAGSNEDGGAKHPRALVAGGRSWATPKRTRMAVRMMVGRGRIPLVPRPSG